MRLERPTLSYWKLWSLSIGFFGIQFGWGLQMANMSAIYEVLGASPSQLPILWLAAPLTGLIVQPIIGQMSDHTWFFRGRRRPYLLGGAILASTALAFMPLAASLWVAALLLWMLDGSVNVSMGPFRALVADIVPSKQRTQGYAVQSVLVALGSVIASALPWILAKVIPSTPSVVKTGIPQTVKLAFWIGAAVYFLAILWTTFSAKEYPPDDPSPLKQHRKKWDFRGSLKELVASLGQMPREMKQLAWVQIFSWAGLFCMFLYFPIAVAHHIFGATEDSGPLYASGVEFAGLCFAFYSVVWFAFSFLLTPLSRAISRRGCHIACLLLGALGLIGILWVEDKSMLFFLMVGVGIAVASIQTLPFAMLADVLPAQKMGVFMGIFNLFITIPEILISLGFGWIMERFLGNNRVYGVVCGGVCMVIAALLTLRVRDRAAFKATR